MEIANGKEDDGITYRCHLDSPNWVVTITHPDGRSLMESFHYSWEPRAGPDVADAEQADKIMEKLINQLREKPTE